MGSKPKITDEQWEQVLAGVQNGLTNKDAHNLAGISETAFYDKRKKDEAFAEKLTRAHISFKTRHVRNIAQAGNPANKHSDWRASAWLLERKFPDEFSERRTMNIETNKPIKLSWFEDEETADDVLPSQSEQEKDSSKPRGDS